MERPNKDNKYYISKKKGGWNPCIVVADQKDNNGVVDAEFDVLANCVGWAVGRFNELAGEGKCKYLGNTNAKDMCKLAEKQGLVVTKEPVVHGAMVWDDGSYGHIEIVESISADGNTCHDSSSGYGLYVLEDRNRKRNAGGANQWGFKTPTKYLGCINPPIKEVLPKVYIEIDGTKYEVQLSKG